MEVKPGYKRSEVGVIPEEWEVRPLGELGTFRNGINKKKEDFGHGFPFVNLLDVFAVPRIYKNLEFGLINSTQSERQIYDLNKGDVLFVRSSVKPEGVGLSSLVSEELSQTVFSGFLIRFRDSGRLAFEYKEHCFSESGFRSRLIARSTISANTNINQEGLKSLLMVFPKSKKEQRAIATALSDVDAFISALDKLIAKKRGIKQATMQQLLTGKMRLPGFEGEWEVKRLGEIASITMGQSPSSLFYNNSANGLPLVQGNADIRNRKTIIRNYTSQITKRCSKGDIILSVRAPVGEVAKADFDACIGRGVCAISYPNEFLYHYLIFFEPKWGKLSKGSTFDSVNSDEVKALEIQLPYNAKEQQAIAAILSDMDAEIVALEERRDKTRALKQGMMQDLLTGKTRLV